MLGFIIIVLICLRLLFIACSQNNNENSNLIISITTGALTGIVSSTIVSLIFTYRIAKKEADIWFRTLYGPFNKFNKGLEDYVQNKIETNEYDTIREEFFKVYSYGTNRFHIYFIKEVNDLLDDIYQEYEKLILTNYKKDEMQNCLIGIDTLKKRFIEIFS